MLNLVHALHMKRLDFDDIHGYSFVTNFLSKKA